ncbi:MAG: P1 family peptidase, partial [Pseudomonadota bacterium]
MMPGSVGNQAHAICLSGGSAYGLDASGGVMHALRAQGRGFQIADAVVPIVPSAIIFDLMIGRRDWDHPPYWDLGRKAAEAAGSDVALGNAGAGMGATAGPLKGGTGTASFQTADYTVGALAVANPVGETVIPGTSTFWAWMLEQNGELGGQTPPVRPLQTAAQTIGQPGENTTLVVIATDAKLDHDQALRVAIMAQDGLAYAIRPVHSPLDGDTVFVLSTGTADAPDPWGGITRLGQFAADAAARAIARGVYRAGPLGGRPSYRETHGTGA